MDILYPLFAALIFPGMLFLAVYGMLSEWLDRKLYAQMRMNDLRRRLSPVACC